MKFSIRDMLLVTMIVALALGWWLDRSRLATLAQEGRNYQNTADYLVTKLQSEMESNRPNQKVTISIGEGGSGIRTTIMPAGGLPPGAKAVKWHLPGNGTAWRVAAPPPASSR